MENIFSNNLIISLGLSITLFSLLAFHRLALHRQKKSEINKAAEKFISVIITEFSEIYPVCSDWPENIDGYLRNKFPTIQTAIENFKPYVTDQNGFEDAWNYYRLGDDGQLIDNQEYCQYKGFTIDDEFIDPKIQLKTNIDRLLSYAK